MSKPVDLAAYSLTPRISTSRQWTALPPDFLHKVQSVFSKQFEIEAGHGEFLVDGRIYPEEVVVRIGYLEKGRLKQVNFEASLDLAKPKATTGDPEKLLNLPEVPEALASEEGDAQSTTMNRLYVCIDAIGSFMEEYFDLGDEEEMDLPHFWRPYEFEQETIYFKYSTVNTRLEDEADRLLGLSTDRLFNALELDGEDALEKAEIDSELAAAIQSAIRSGKIPSGHGFASPESTDETEYDEERPH